ncbi:MAG: hypothetical protein FWH12_01155 [Treponema sp.]|nr:hypothetical protein [Treponema sp.]
MIFLALSVGALILGTSCVSGANARLTGDRTPIALVSLVANGDITWSGEGPVDAARLVASQRRTLERDSDLAVNVRSAELIDSAEAIFREVLETSLLIFLADPEDYLHTEAYEGAQLHRGHIREERASPEGYRMINPRDRDFPLALERETGIGRVMFVEFELSKAMSSGIGRTGQLRAQVDMTVDVLDATGRSLFRRRLSVQSSGSIRVASGIYSSSELIILFEDAIYDISYYFLDIIAP